MSDVTQEQKLQSRFRLARVDPSGPKLPPIAKELPLPLTVAPALSSSAPYEPELAESAIAIRLDGCDGFALEVSGLEQEALDQGQAVKAELEAAAPPPPAGPMRLKLTLQPASLPPAKPIGNFAPITYSAIAVETPIADLPPIRARYVRGPNPNAQPAAKPEPEALKPQDVKAPETKPEPKPEAPATKVPETKPEPKAAETKSAPAKPEPKPEPRQSSPKPAETRPAAPARTPEPQKQADPPAKPKISIRPAEPSKPARPEIRRPTTMVARTSAQPAALPEPMAEPAPPAPAPVAEPKVIPIRKTDPAPAAKPVELEVPSLAAAPAAGSGMGLKLGIAAAVLVVLGGGGYYFMRGGSAAHEGSTAPAVDVAQPLPSLGGAGWSSNWGSDAPVNKGKQIALYRPTMTATDYRIEIHGQIERKAMGWIFRAQNPNNYYVVKVEWVKTGADPVAALVRYAVIDGKETTHTQLLLPIENLTLTTLFRVRTDVKGDRFTTYVNDKPVDYWNDDRVTLGGAGVYSEDGERAIIKTTNIAALR